MNAKSFTLATLAGGVVLLVTGFLFYGLLLADFMRANLAPGLMKDEPDAAPLVIGELVVAAFLTLVLSNWAGAQNMAKGAKVGAVVGLMLGFGLALEFYATSNMMEAAMIPVDTVVWAIRMGLAGGAVGAVLGRN